MVTQIHYSIFFSANDWSFKKFLFSTVLKKKKRKKNVVDIDRLWGKLNVAQFSNVFFHDVHGQFSPLHFFIFLLKIFKEFTSLYSGGRFAQRKGAPEHIVSKS